MEFSKSFAKKAAYIGIGSIMLTVYPVFDDEGHIHEHPAHGEHPVPLPGPPIQMNMMYSTTSTVSSSTSISS